MLPRDLFRAGTEPLLNIVVSMDVSGKVEYVNFLLIASLGLGLI